MSFLQNTSGRLFLNSLRTFSLTVTFILGGILFMVLFYGSFLVYNFSFVPDGLYNTIRHIVKVVLK